MAPELVAVTGAGGFIGRATVAALMAGDIAHAGLVGPDEPEPQRLAAPTRPGSMGVGCGRRPWHCRPAA